jgi:hypothetical protein
MNIEQNGSNGNQAYKNYQAPVKGNFFCQIPRLNAINAQAQQTYSQKTTTQNIESVLFCQSNHHCQHENNQIQGKEQGYSQLGAPPDPFIIQIK